RKVKTVVFGSSGESITALMGGHVDLVVGPVSIAAQRGKTGEIRALALTAPRRRAGALADVPTWKELDLNAVVDNWRGLIGPKGMPAEQVAFWDRALGRMFQLEEWKKDVERNDWDNAAMVSRESARYLAETYQE